MTLIFQTYSGNAWAPKYKSKQIPGVVRDRLFNYNSKIKNNPEAFMLDERYSSPHSSDYKYLTHKNLQYDGQEPNSMHLRRAEGIADEMYAVRRKRDVWTVTVASYKGAHFATFPEKLIEPCIMAGSKPGDVVLDPFNGSGTTGVVAMKNDRKYIGVELNPEYVKLTEDRFDDMRGVVKLVNQETGEVDKYELVDLF